jgi:hypothetical protein
MEGREGLRQRRRNSTVKEREVFQGESYMNLEAWEPMRMKVPRAGGKEFHKSFEDACLSVKCFSGPPILAFSTGFA